MPDEQPVIKTALSLIVAPEIILRDHGTQAEQYHAHDKIGRPPFPQCNKIEIKMTYKGLLVVVMSG
jgi:hypothetical protein